MIIIDLHLIDLVRAKAGRNIHDTEASIGIYRAASINYNNWINVEAKKDRLHRQKFLSEKHERILRSFLVTHDIKKSRRIVEEILPE